MKSRKIRISVLLAVLFLPLSGCKETFDFLPYAREIEDMALVRTLGVDMAEEGIRVTASTGVQDQGAKAPTVLEQKGEAISAACLTMQAQGAAYVFYGHVGQLILGEDLAGQGIQSVLDYVLCDIEMRLETNLYVFQGQAGPAIWAAAEQSSATEQLEALEADEGLLSDFTHRTVEDVMEDLEENGDSFVPALTLNEEQKRLEPAGYALLKEGALAGWAQGEDAKGVNLLIGRVEADVLEAIFPDGSRAALRIVDAETQVKPVFQGNMLIGLTLRCQVDANLAESANATGSADLYAAEQTLEEACQARLERAADLCRELGGDFFQLKARAGRNAPWYWRAIQDQWSLEDLEVDVEVEAHIQRSYNMRDT